MGTLTIQIPDSVRAKLDELSKQKHLPAEEFARQMLEKALALEQFRQLRLELRPYAQKAGFETDEDVFKAVS